MLFAVVAKDLRIGRHIQFHRRWRLVIKSTKTCHSLRILPGGRPPIRLIRLGSSQASRSFISDLIKRLCDCLSFPRNGRSGGRNGFMSLRCIIAMVKLFASVVPKAGWHGAFELILVLALVEFSIQEDLILYFKVLLGPIFMSNGLTPGKQLSVILSPHITNL